MNTPNLETTDPKAPILWIPGWAVPVYVELVAIDGVDALQQVILGLMEAGCVGLGGSLANELCIEETIVESALMALHADGWIHREEDEWKKTPGREDEERQAERRIGWVFWDSLRYRLLPEMLLDDLGSSRIAFSATDQSSQILDRSEFQPPSFGEVKAELIPTVEGKGFAVRSLKPSSSSYALEQVETPILRVSPQRSRRKVVWHPLVVPYRIEPNLGVSPSIYCCEPLYDRQLGFASPYNPSLRAIIQEKLSKSFRPIMVLAEELQSKERVKHGAGFLAKMGGPEKLDAEARSAALRMLGGTLPDGPFAVSELYNRAEDAERIWLTTAELPQSSASIRAQYSMILQALATCLSDEMLPLWQNNHSIRRMAQKFPSRWDAGKRGLNFDDGKQRWDAEVRRFSKMHGIPFDTLGINTAGEMKSDATYPFRRTQLGVAIRSWAAFAVAAESDPDGSFVLTWIFESLTYFPSLFTAFQRFTDQRNLDKGRSFDNVPIGEYRDGIYKIWKAVAEGYKRAANQNNS